VSRAALWGVWLAVFAGLGAGPVTRESREVQVAGVTETWRIEFLEPPGDACFDLACPCIGFAYGERGHADLVRVRSSREVERMRLDPLFRDLDIPDAGDGESLLPHWPELHGDLERLAKDDTAIPVQWIPSIKRRRAVRILEIRDFDGDGRATEFLLGVTTEPCGRVGMVAVGVSKANPRLHVFTTAEHPTERLILLRETWLALLAKPKGARAVDLPCGDHGSAEQVEIALSRDRKGLHARRETFACDVDGEGVATGLRAPKKLLRSEEL
jgi:hypothetical protein